VSVGDAIEPAFQRAGRGTVAAPDALDSLAYLTQGENAEEDFLIGQAGEPRGDRPSCALSLA